jgi:hypothetical protein
VTTGIYSPDTRPVLHGLLVDPAAPHLLMLDVRNFAKQTLRCFPTAGNLWEVRVTSSTQPDVLAAVIEIDPRRGCLPSRSQIYDGAGALVQETTYEWERVSGRWFCRRFETVNHGQVALNGEAFGRRVCRLVYDELELDITADPKLFQMESLEIPPGTAIADLRKDALDPYLVYKPESDPRQQELDRMVEQAGRMIVTTAAEGLAQSRWLLAAFTAAGLLGISALLYIARRVNVRRRLASPPGAGRAS